MQHSQRREKTHTHKEVQSQQEKHKILDTLYENLNTNPGKYISLWANTKTKIDSRLGTSYRWQMASFLLGEVNIRSTLVTSAPFATPMKKKQHNTLSNTAAPAKIFKATVTVDTFSPSRKAKGEKHFLIEYYYVDELFLLATILIVCGYQIL